MPRKIPDETSQPTPFGDWGLRYFESEIGSPIALPPGKKAPPPDGFTGRNRREVDIPDLMEWAPESNVGLVLPDDLVGIDVDAYGDKPGGETFGRLLEELGPLPPTYVSSARSDLVSGIRLYWLDADSVGRLPGEAGPGVDLIRPHHRYVVAPGSIHPNGSRYRWFWVDQDWQELTPETTPVYDEIPALPEAWAEHLLADQIDTAFHATPGGGEWGPQDAGRPKSGTVLDHFYDSFGNDPAERQSAVVRWLIDEYGFHSPRGPIQAGGRTSVRLTRKGKQSGTSISVLDGGAIWVYSSDPEAGPPELPRNESMTPQYFMAGMEHGGDLKPVIAKLAQAHPEWVTDPTEVDTETLDEWARIDLAELLAAGYTPPEPGLMVRTDNHGLIYPGKLNVIFGQPEAGKSWMAAAAAIQIIRGALLALQNPDFAADEEAAERPIDVVWLDFEDSPDTFVNRLRQFDGMPDLRKVIQRISYYQPPAGRTLVGDPLIEHLDQGGQLSRAKLVVVDSWNEAMYAMGFDPLSNTEVGAFRAMFLTPLERATSGALLVLDHTTKDAQGSERHAIGAQTKLSGVSGSQFHATTKPDTQPAPGKNGYVGLKVTKDRHGIVRSRSLGDLAATAHFEPRGDKLRITFLPPMKPQHDQLREAITRYLLKVGQPQSKRQIRSAVKGNDQNKISQIEALAVEGFIEEILPDKPGGNILYRGLHLWSVLPPEVDDEADASEGDSQ